jgi:hypothetical protein
MIHRCWQRCRCEKTASVRAIGVLLAFTLSLPACVFHQTYPSAWAPRVASCEDISGIYSDAGERWAQRTPYPVTETVVATRSLSALLLGTGGHGKTFRVQLAQRGAHTLDFRIWVDDSVGAQYSTECRCTPQGVEVTMPAQWMMQGLAAVRTWGTLYLTKDTDGNLIGNLQYRTYGIILIVPIVSAGNPWYRFRQEAPLRMP